MKKALFVLFLVFLQSVNLLAGSFRHLNIEHGLSSRQVFQIKKDSAGFVWILTNMGIDRYDGTEIKHYKLDKTPELKDQTLSSSIMTCDRSGKLWVSMKNGSVYFYNQQTDAFFLQINLSDHFSGKPILNDILFDKESRLWICLSTGLYLFDIKKNQLTAVAGFANEYVTRIIQTDNETFFVGTNAHVFRLRKNGKNSFLIPDQIILPVKARIESLCAVRNKLYVGTFSNSAFTIDLHSGKVTSLGQLIPAVPVRSIVSIGGDRVLVGTDGSGLYSLETSSDRLIQRYISNEDDKSSLSGNTITDILVDQGNRVWISTYTNGVSILDPQYPEIHWIKHEYRNSNSLVSNHVNVIMEDSDGDLWYGTNNGVSLYQSRTNKWVHFLNDKGGDSDYSFVVLALCEDEQKNIWVGGYGIGVFCINKQSGKIQKMKSRENSANNGTSSDYIFSIYAEGNYIWLGGIEGEFTRYNTRTKNYTYYPINCIGDIKPGKDNTLLLAGCDGLAFFNKNNGNAVWYRTFSNHSLHYPIRCLLQASSGDLWMATDGDGLIRFNPKNNLSEIFTVGNGPLSNAINCLLEDKMGRIWFSTEKKLYCLDLKTGVITSMNEFIGVEWGYYNSNAGIVKRNGNLVFGTAEGVLEFSPHLNMEQKDSIKLILTDFKLLYKSVQAGVEGSPLKKSINETSSIALKYAQNSFSISFSSINLAHPHQIEYEYKLVGFDNDWRQSGSVHSVDYMNLPPGKYLFKLKAINKYTKKTLGERSVEMVIGKPFWSSNWALLLYFAVVSFLVFLMIQYGRNKIAEHDSKEKIRFFINVAHDIRTPVTLIKAPLSELETQEALSEHGRKSLSVAIKNAEKLFMLVTQLLDLQKVDLDAEKLTVTKQDAYSYMQEKIGSFRVMAIQKGIDLYLEVASDFPEVYFDKNKMDKIIDNLLSNAIKYTEKGFVSVIIKHTSKEWSIEIQDTGIGIPITEQKHLFKEFYRAGNAINSNESGSGIGLLLTKKLVKFHHGSVTYSSVENTGSSFVVTLPIKIKPSIPVVEESDLASNKQEQTSFTPSGKEILLLAEDNNDMREYLTDSLSQEYHVISVNDGGKALELAKEINPDIIISDMLMPVLRGDEMCKILKSSMETSHIPFILLSALSEKENIILGLEAGANDYITKPFDFSVLKVRIRNILQSREQLRKTIFSTGTGLEDVNYANQLDKEFLDKAIRIIEMELANPEFSIIEFCRMLGMSRTSVYNKMKTLTDQAPNDFIRIIRLNKAKELLKSKKYAISEVSYMVGFSDPKYFSTSFKKQFGISPSKVN